MTTTTVARSTTTTAPPAGSGPGVAGHVTAGPTCPVQRADQPCPPTPVSGVVEAVDASGQVVGRDGTDQAGAYAISLPPGRYTLEVRLQGTYPRCPDTPISVPAGSPVTVDIGCDTGIR